MQNYKKNITTHLPFLQMFLHISPESFGLQQPWLLAASKKDEIAALKTFLTGFLFINPVKLCCGNYDIQKLWLPLLPKFNPLQRI